MACQSLDNDEILNVRWATEDPNPVSKVLERERLEEVGRKAIQERMDPKIIEAMRAVRALEDEEVLDNGEEEGPQVSEIHTLEDAEEDERDPKRRRLALPEPIEDKPKAVGLLSADTMEGLKYFAEIRKRQAQNAPPVKSASNGLLAADYGSDDD